MLRVTHVEGIKKAQGLLLKARERLEQGGLLALPGESGYRWVVRADLPPAVARLRHGLLRAEGRPLCLQVGDLDRLETALGQELGGRARQLAQAFWPGPLVMILPRGGAIAAEGGFRKLGVRMPQHPLAAEFLKLCPFPVLSGGAHGPGFSRLTRGSQVVNVFAGRPGFVEAGGEVLTWKEPSLALEPTVVDLAHNPPRLMRCGFIRAEEVRAVAPGPWLLSGERGIPSGRSSVSESHLVVVEGDRAPRRLKTLLDAYPRSQRMALLVSPETAELAFSPPPRHLVYFATVEQPEALFDIIQVAEKKHRASIILIEGVARSGPGAALMERLCQMAHEVINTEDPGYRGQAGLTSKEPPSSLRPKPIPGA